MLIPTKSVDVLKVGAAYLHCLGDVPRTAVVAGVTQDVVRQLEREWDWASKLAEWQQTKLATKDDSDEIKVNRTQNLIQARRLRDLLDKVVSSLLESDNEELVEFFTRYDKKTESRVAETKPLVDIARTAEIVHALTYRALGDTQSDTSEGPKTQDVALAVAGALNKVLDKLPGGPVPHLVQAIDVTPRKTP